MSYGYSPKCKGCVGDDCGSCKVYQDWKRANWEPADAFGKLIVLADDEPAADRAA